MAETAPILAVPGSPPLANSVPAPNADAQKKPDYSNIPTKDDTQNPGVAATEDADQAASDWAYIFEHRHPAGLPPQPNSPNYKGMGFGGGTGAAFNVDAAVDLLAQKCGAKPGGSCLAHVADALLAGGFDIRAGMATRNGSHYAKDAAAVLEAHSGQFKDVCDGAGANMQNADYKPQAGDIVVWEGGEYGHIAMCVGQRADGSAMWQSDYTAREGNWTGLANPASMGEFHIFRQNPKEAAMTPAPDQGVKAATRTQKMVAPGFHA